MNPWLDSYGRLRSGWRFLLGVIVWFLANYIAIAIAGPLSHDRARYLDAMYRPLALLFLLAGFSFLLVTADRVEGNPLPALGLGRFPGWLRQLAIGLAIGAGLIAIAFACIAAFGNLREIKFTISNHSLELALVELMILATGALAEELMFRGYPFQRLLESMPGAIAVLIMSVLFALAHWGNPHTSRMAMINTAAVGVLFSVAYLRTRALWMPWGLHFAWNTALGMVFGLPVSGLTDFAVLVRTRATGPRWLTGGAYGIEASALGLVVILLGFIPVLLVTRRKPQPVASSAQPAWDQQSSPDRPAAGGIQP
ncbi:MAG: CPBP family intramembrane glutamic endopeptidase [Terriglobales bacterium]